jgi:hypothetical protein
MRASRRTQEVTVSDRAASLSRALSRRRLARGLLAVGSLGAVGLASPAGAQADPREKKRKKVKFWAVSGNDHLKPNHFLGAKNVVALVFKTAATPGSPVERMRIEPTGEVLVAGLLQAATLTVNGLVSAANKLVAITTDPAGTGISGTAPNNLTTAPGARGVLGTGTVGVAGQGLQAGVQGSSPNGNAVQGDTETGVAVKGQATGDGGAVKAVHGRALGSSNNGVVGEASVGTSAYGVWGISTTGYAGVFSGKVLITGTVSKGGGSFKIDHPLDPAHKYLYHSFVESPDMMNVYNGNVTTGPDGRATVELPGYFEALNRDFRYQLTVIGRFAQAVVGREIADGSFVIETDQPGVRVSWQVTGIRKDAFANAHRIPVEEDKAGEEAGTYLHPELFGKPAGAGFQAGRLT